MVADLTARRGEAAIEDDAVRAGGELAQARLGRERGLTALARAGTVARTGRDRLYAQDAQHPPHVGQRLATRARDLLDGFGGPARVRQDSRR